MVIGAVEVWYYFSHHLSVAAQCMQTANMRCEQTAKTSCATSCAPPTPTLCSSLWQSTTISTYTQWIQTLTSLNLLKSDSLAMMSDCRSITPHQFVNWLWPYRSHTSWSSVLSILRQVDACCRPPNGWNGIPQNFELPTSSILTGSSKDITLQRVMIHFTITENIEYLLHYCWIYWGWY